MLAKGKLNSIELLMSQALIDLDISHEEFKTIVNEKEKYEQMKESIRNTKSRGHEDRNIDYEIQRQKALAKELGCEFIRINPDKENFNIFKAINEIHRHIKESIKRSTKESTQKSVINDIRLGLAELSLGFEKNTKTVNKFLKRAFKHVVPKP